MTHSHDPARRFKRGQHPRPLRYWSAFFVFSLITHAAILAGVSGAAAEFIDGLSAPRPQAEPRVYISLIFQPPGDIGPGQPVNPGNKRDTRPRLRLVMDSREKSAPANNTPVSRKLPAPSDVSKTGRPLAFKPPDTPAEANREDAYRAAPAVKSVKAQHAAVVSQVQLPALDTDDTMEQLRSIEAGRRAASMYREYFKPSDDSVIVIKGTEVTMTEALSARPSAPKAATPDIRQTIEPPDDTAPAMAVKTPGMPGFASAVLGLPGGLSGYAPRMEAAPAPSGKADAQPTARLAEAGYIDKQGRTPLLDRMTALAAYLLVDNGVATFGNAAMNTVPGPAGPSMAKGAGAAPARNPEIPEPEVRQPPLIIIVEDYGDAEAEQVPPEITITSPAPGDTGKGLVDVTGEVSGEGIRSVYLWQDGRKMEVLVSGGRFTRSVSLEEGKNSLEAVAVDSAGRTATARVEVNYVAGGAGPVVRIQTPADGDTIDALVQKEVTISGLVDGAGVTSLRMYMNRGIMDIPVTGGTFSYTARVEAEDNTLFAEATDTGGLTSRSATVHFTAANLYPKDLIVQALMDSGVSGITVVKRWRRHPRSDDYKDTGPGYAVTPTRTGAVVSVDRVRSGIYTVGLEYKLKPGTVQDVRFRVTLYGYDEKKKIFREFGPFTMRGAGYIPAVRLLLPEAVFWEDDAWFSGIVDSSSGTMKFRQPEGISWTEEQ